LEVITKKIILSGDDLVDIVKITLEMFEDTILQSGENTQILRA